MGRYEAFGGHEAFGGYEAVGEHDPFGKRTTYIAPKASALDLSLSLYEAY